MFVNNAKDCLSNKARRDDYDAALQKYGLPDGLHKDNNWEESLKKRRNRAPTEVN